MRAAASSACSRGTPEPKEYFTTGDCRIARRSARHNRGSGVTHRRGLFVPGRDQPLCAHRPSSSPDEDRRCLPAGRAPRLSGDPGSNRGAAIPAGRDPDATDTNRHIPLTRGKGLRTGPAPKERAIDQAHAVIPALPATTAAPTMPTTQSPRRSATTTRTARSRVQASSNSATPRAAAGCLRPSVIRPSYPSRSGTVRPARRSYSYSYSEPVPGADDALKQHLERRDHHGSRV